MNNDASGRLVTINSRQAGWRVSLVACLLLIGVTYGASRETAATDRPRGSEVPTVASMLTSAKAADGKYISWIEHRIDDREMSGINGLSGGDGLQMADLDGDGYMDIVYVCEEDTVYDGVARGLIRIAFGTKDPNKWETVTLADGPEAGAAEDVAIGDLNGDGHPDIVAACELAHLIYFQNPGKDARTARWKRVMPPVTLNRGSWIRAFFADLDRDGRPEVIAANKGAQNPRIDTPETHAISWFKIAGDPLDGANWAEHVLTRVHIPQSSPPVDLDRDGDIDVVSVSRGEHRILWSENLGGSPVAFKEHAIHVGREKESIPVDGVQMDFVDLNGDGRLDIVLATSPRKFLIWLEQPANPAEPTACWDLHQVGDVSPDANIGITVADINGDGKPDIMTGTYSAGARDHDGEKVTAESPVGRLAWFENPGNPYKLWIRRDIDRRKRGMYDMFVARDMDGDGDIDFVSTKGNADPYDGAFWLEQVRTRKPVPNFISAFPKESEEVALPALQREY